MYFIYISKAETGLIVRTPITISPHPPPTKAKEIWLKGEDAGNVFQREKLLQGVMAKATCMCLASFCLFTSCGRNDETNCGCLLRKAQFSLSFYFYTPFQATNSLGCFLSLGKSGKYKLD